MHERIHVLIIALCALLPLLACKIIDTTVVQSDGSGWYQRETGVTDEEIAQHGLSTFCNAVDLERVVTYVKERRGDETWCVASQQFADLDALRAIYTKNVSITVNQLEIKDDTFTYDVDFLPSTAETSTSGIQPDSFWWRVTMPGRIIADNANKSENNTLTWILVPGNKLHLHAVSTFPAFDFVTSATEAGTILGVGWSLTFLVAQWPRKKHSAETTATCLE